MADTTFGQRLRAATDEHGPLCAGIDPHRSLVESWGLGYDLDGLRRFTDACVEAFAGQVLACCAQLGLDPARVCTEGGALGLGHPWGASGGVLVVRLFSRLVRQGAGRLGLAAIAAGGGQGVAVVVESVQATG